MEKEKNEIKQESIVGRVRFKPLPFDEQQAFRRLDNRLRLQVLFSSVSKVNRIWKYWSLAASVALLVAVAIFFVDEREEQALVYYETTAVPDAKTKITLPDSSVVWLNANACLRYPREFSSACRQVTIKGEALFEVRKDEKKPFIVQTEDIGIKVFGTTFNVEAEVDKTVVTLLTGKVGIYTKMNHTTVADRILKPGEQAVYEKSKTGLTVLETNTDNTISWVTGIFHFKDRTLEDIMKELQRAFHVKIHIENEALKKQTFNADFTDKETLDEILSILQISARYQIEKMKGEIFLK